MTFIKPKFDKTSQTEFFSTLRVKVHEYFKENEISVYGNWEMVTKTIVVFAMYFVPFILMLTGVITNLWIIFAMWILMGIGQAGIGMNVMHDANHNAYSKKKFWNRLLGWSVNLIGANDAMWKIQHNVLHHTYTNIEGADDDIKTPGVLRMSPHQKKYWIHRFQHLYFWIFYGVSTLFWVLTKDYFQVAKYRKRNLISTKKRFNKELTKMILWKVLYFAYAFMLPALILPISFPFFLLCWVMMHFTTGLLLTLVFQTAHVMPSSDFLIPDEKGKINRDWATHQLNTTSNFAPRSRVFSWFIGGLNYQIEHHLFTNICHVHYRKISKIVAKTAEQYGITYNSEKYWISALWKHIKLLKKLGRMDMVPAVV